MEWLKHLLGICGESHPSLLTILMGTPILGWALYWFKSFWK